MAHYITNSLEEDEQIVFQGHLHWMAIAKYMISSISLLLAAGGFIASGYYTTHQKLYAIGTIILLIAIVIYIIGRVVRTRSEFAVTTTRFIQNDGILNIKMTEIPLFKIETVNFYQSLWQRLLGTGSIELVGSGGTFHRLNYIERPHIVRRTIVGTINRKPNKE